MIRFFFYKGINFSIFFKARR